MQKFIEAIADPNRRQILNLLKTQDMSVGELMQHFHITGASMSHHLNKLKSADLIQVRRNGQHLIYAINTSVFEDAAQLVMNFFQTKGGMNK